MRALREVRRAASGALVVLLPVLVSCSSDDDDPAGLSDPLVGTWNATSFVAGTDDVIALGMDLSIAFSAADTYTLTVTNDLIEARDGAADCTQTGSYAATSTQLTIDPGTVDSITFGYTIQGNTLTLTGSMDGIPVTVVLTRA
jgi:hypothetical protein